MVGLIIALVLLGITFLLMIMFIGAALIRSAQISHEEEEKEIYKNCHKRK